MEHQVALCLFKYCNCTLPGIGLLKIEQQPAIFSGVEETITLPVPVVIFHPGLKTDDQLAQFVAANKNISFETAQQHVEQFCNNILKNNSHVVIPSVGEFYNENGKVNFKRYDLPKEIYPVVAAKTVSRTQNHSILVGNKESTATKMTAYYSEQNTPVRSWWKVAAMVLFLVAGGYLTYYFIYEKQTGGNSQKIDVRQESSTYSVPQN